MNTQHPDAPRAGAVYFSAAYRANVHVRSVDVADRTAYTREFGWVDWSDLLPAQKD